MYTFLCQFYGTAPTHSLLIPYSLVPTTLSSPQGPENTTVTAPVPEFLNSPICSDRLSLIL